MQPNTGCAFTPGAAILQFQIAHVGNKVRLPGAVAFNLLSLATVVSFLTAEAIVEAKRVIEYEIEITKPVDHQRRVGHGEIARRSVALDVEVLVPGIERRQKQTPLLPFESLFAPVVIPHRGRTPALHNVDELLEHITLWQALLLGGYFTEMNVASAPGADQIDKGTQHSFSTPGRQ